MFTAQVYPAYVVRTKLMLRLILRWKAIRMLQRLICLLLLVRLALLRLFLLRKSLLVPRLKLRFRRALLLRTEHLLLRSSERQSLPLHPESITLLQLHVAKLLSITY